MMPIITVTKLGFTALINTLDKRYSVPPRTCFSQVAIPELYKKFKKSDCRAEFFATTSDMWSSCTVKPYQSLTCILLMKTYT